MVINESVVSSNFRNITFFIFFILILTPKLANIHKHSPSVKRSTNTSMEKLNTAIMNPRIMRKIQSAPMNDTKSR